MVDLESKFGGAVKQHGSMVYSLALYFLRNQAWAEEIAQDVFCSLYESRGEIRSEPHLEAWLRRATLHRCIDHSRKHSVRRERPLLDGADFAGRTEDSDCLAHRHVRAQLAQLPEHQRAVVLLRYQEEMEPTEIAEVLQIPVNTVKSRLHRALETLRSRFPMTSATRKQAV